MNTTSIDRSDVQHSDGFFAACGLYSGIARFPQTFGNSESDEGLVLNHENDRSTGTVGGCFAGSPESQLSPQPRPPRHAPTTPVARHARSNIWTAETRMDAEAAFDGFIESYGIKYEKAVECLSKDREPLLAFYDFPAEHWKHLRTTNPIESTFATVRHRTVRSRGCLSNKTALAMIYNLAQAAEKSWNRLRGHNQLPKVTRCKVQRWNRGR